MINPFQYPPEKCIFRQNFSAMIYGIDQFKYQDVLEILKNPSKAKLNKKSKTENAAIWKDVANRLGRSNRRTAEVNLSDIARYANADETVLVPGKVLSNGDLTEKVNVAAFKFSQKAQEKIESAGGECVSIDDIMESNPKGSNIRIME